MRNARFSLKPGGRDETRRKWTKGVAIEKTPPGKNGEVQLTDALRILMKKRPLYAFEFDGRRLDIGTKHDWLRANLILGLEQEPWRTTIEETLREHPEGKRLMAAWPRSAGAPKTRKRHP